MGSCFRLVEMFGLLVFAAIVCLPYRPLPPPPPPPPPLPSPVLLPFERLLSSTAEYCRERKAFGRPLLNNQVIHYRLAELETEVEAVRSLLYRTIGQWETLVFVCFLFAQLLCLFVCLIFLYFSGLYLKGHDTTKLASMAKLKAGRLARELSDCCLQFWGGMGYTYEVEVSR